MKFFNSLITGLFFLINISLGFSQDCLPETMVNNSEINKKVAKAVKVYCHENKVTYKYEYSVKNIAGEYLRHSFIKDWQYSAENGTPYRFAFVNVAVKTAKGCMITVLYLVQVSLGGESFGDISVYNFIGTPSYSKYLKETVDCDCVMKIKDWEKE